MMLAENRERPPLLPERLRDHARRDDDHRRGRPDPLFQQGGGGNQRLPAGRGAGEIVRAPRLRHLRRAHVRGQAEEMRPFQGRVDLQQALPHQGQGRQARLPAEKRRGAARRGGRDHRRRRDDDRRDLALHEGAGTRGTEGGTAPGVLVHGASRVERSDAAPLRTDTQRRPERGAGSHLRGERHREEPDRQRDPRPRPAQGETLHQDELLGAQREPSGERALRPQKGFVHRRPERQDRQVRGRRRGQHPPGRDRRHVAADAGQAAPGPRGEDRRAGGRERGDTRQRAGHLGDEPGPARVDPHGPVPGGPLLPRERHPDQDAGAAGAPRGHPDAHRALPEEDLGREQQGRAPREPPRDGHPLPLPLAGQRAAADQRPRAQFHHLRRRHGGALRPSRLPLPAPAGRACREGGRPGAAGRGARPVQGQQDPGGQAPGNQPRHPLEEAQGRDTSSNRRQATRSLLSGAAVVLSATHHGPELHPGSRTSSAGCRATLRSCPRFSRPCGTASWSSTTRASSAFSTARPKR